MALISGSHPWRKHDHLVGHGKGVGKIRNVHTSAFFLIIVLRGPCSALDVRSLASRRPRYEDLRSRDERWGGDRRADAYARAWRHRRGADRLAQLDDV